MLTDVVILIVIVILLVALYLYKKRLDAIRQYKEKIQHTDELTEDSISDDDETP